AFDNREQDRRDRRFLRARRLPVYANPHLLQRDAASLGLRCIDLGCPRNLAAGRVARRRRCELPGKSGAPPAGDDRILGDHGAGLARREPDPALLFAYAAIGTWT